MEKITEKQAVEILKKHAPSNSVFQKVYQHSKTVQRAALNIARQVKKNNHDVDLHFIKIGSLLHDLGRFEAPPRHEKSLRHGLIGAKILRKEGLPESYARLCERHLGAGITREDIVRHGLPLPKKDFIPRTIEEKIITYADDLIFKDRIATPSEVLQRFQKEIKNPAAVKRMIELHNEIEKLRGGTYFIK